LTRISFIVLMLSLPLALTGCQSSTPTLLPTPQPTPTAIPTPVPTPTPKPTASPTPTATPAVLKALELPADDASHTADVEWWYYNGFLEAADGSQYGFHAAMFELGGTIVPIEILMGHLAITDHQTETFTFGQVLGQKLGEEPLEGFAATVRGLRVSGFEGEYELAGSVEGYDLDLSFSAVKPPVLHGGDGLLDFHEAGKTYYYTYPRLEVTGVLTAGDVSQDVTGTGWLDHQWGDFRAFEVGWDWFSLQLDDDTELMFFSVWAPDGQILGRLATFVNEDGSAVTVDGDDIVLRSNAIWTSPKTGGQYPSNWQIDIEALGMSLALEPLVADSEFIPPDPITPIYWEGQVAVQGVREGQAVEGRGFVELVGYAEGQPAS
jgi:predicted secreted hydrolase